jgi:hypothetical protein
VTISNRHIRHDWQTFVDWDQVSVRSLCGSTTRRGLAGIPGVTDQPAIVAVKDKQKWGWCSACLRSAMRTISHIDANVEMIPEIKAVYALAIDTMYGQYNWLLERDQKAKDKREIIRQQRLAKDAAKV